jgi:hypothetical protein
MRQLFYLLPGTAVLVLAGCATRTAPYLAKLEIDSPAGNYMQFNTHFQPKPDGRDSSAFLIAFHDLHVSTEWAPSATVCLQGAAPQEAELCFGLSVSRDGTTVTPARIERSSGQDREPYRLEFSPRAFGRGKFRLLMEYDNGKTAFTLDGDKLFESAHMVSPASYSFSCSSSLCDITIAQ